MIDSTAGVSSEQHMASPYVTAVSQPPQGGRMLKGKWTGLWQVTRTRVLVHKRVLLSLSEIRVFCKICVYIDFLGRLH